MTHLQHDDIVDPQSQNTDGHTPKRRKTSEINLRSTRPFGGGEDEVIFDRQITTITNAPPAMKHLPHPSRRSAGSAIDHDHFQQSEYAKVDETYNSYRRKNSGQHQSQRSNSQRESIVGDTDSRGMRQPLHSRPPTGKEPRRLVHPPAYQELDYEIAIQDDRSNPRSDEEDDEHVDLVQPNVVVSPSENRLTNLASTFTNNAPHRASKEEKRAQEFRRQDETGQQLIEMDDMDELEADNSEYRIRGVANAVPATRSNPDSHGRSSNGIAPTKWTKSYHADGAPLSTRQRSSATNMFRLANLKSETCNRSEVFLRRSGGNAYHLMEGSMVLLSIPCREWTSILYARDGTLLRVSCKQNASEEHSCRSSHLLLTFQSAPELKGFVGEAYNMLQRKIPFTEREE